MTRRELILAVASDAGMDFMYYNRKDDENLPRGEIEKAIKAGEITVEEILEAFKKGAGL